MIDFEYAAPTVLSEAIELLADDTKQSRILAGGTDMIVQLREGHREADIVVDVKKIPELMQFGYSPEVGLQLGASVPCSRINQDRDVAANYTALAEATHIIGGWQIQSRASVGGNLCNSSPAADSIPPLMVHQAVCHIAGPSGRHSLPADQFCTAPGKNRLQQGELLVAITLPPAQPRTGSAYQRFIPRNEMDIAVAGVASYVQLDESLANIEDARVAFAAVAPTPILATSVGDWLRGRPASDDVCEEAGELAMKEASPISDMRGTAEYRTHLIRVLTKRTLRVAVERARASSCS